MTNETKNQRTDQRWKLARPRTEPIVEVDESWALALLDDVHQQESEHSHHPSHSAENECSIDPADEITVSDRPSAIEAQMLWRKQHIVESPSNDEPQNKLKVLFSKWYGNKQVN